MLSSISTFFLNWFILRTCFKVMLCNMNLDSHGSTETIKSQALLPSCFYEDDLPFPPPPRQLALKALNERLKRVEDQSAWPSMDDEEDDEEDEVRTDTQPLLSVGRDPSSSTQRSAGGPIGVSLSSTSSSSMSQSGGGQSTSGAQHPESSIISFEDAPSRS